MTDDRPERTMEPDAGGIRQGPLGGIRIIEMAGIGPVPLAGLILSELGADVLRIERRGGGGGFSPNMPDFDTDRHGRTIVCADLRRPEGVALARDLCRSADALIEGFRPGVMERLGLGPESCRGENPGLIYARMTGYGQEGPLAARAGHDLTYLALSGILHAIGPGDGRPVPPLNLVADLGGGTMFLVAGILAALLERQRSGLGQVIDAAMIDGAGMLSLPYFGYVASGFWSERRAANLLDSGAPFYDTYAASDGRHVAIACLEPKFFAEFAALLPLGPAFADRQYDRETWPEMRREIAARIALRTRDEWTEYFDGTDACVMPVLTWTEARSHPHNRARKAHVPVGPFVRPAPAPRFSRTPATPAGMAVRGADGAIAALRRFGIDPARGQALFDGGVLTE